MHICMLITFHKSAHVYLCACIYDLCVRDFTALLSSLAFGEYMVTWLEGVWIFDSRSLSFAG